MMIGDDDDEYDGRKLSFKTEVLKNLQRDLDEMKSNESGTSTSDGIKKKNKKGYENK